LRDDSLIKTPTNLTATLTCKQSPRLPPLSRYPSAYRVGEPWKDVGHGGRILEN